VKKGCQVVERNQGVVVAVAINVEAGFDGCSAE
jgi:hypothetical protein